MRDSAGFAPASLGYTGRGYVPGAARIPHTHERCSRAILTIGNEVVSGDVVNTNAAWLAQRLESLGVHVVLAAAVPDEIDTIAELRAPRA